ncbi:MAG TPA: hypothetical protein P5072_03765 [Parvularculaceae bacterium]|nr:hypothetical protein [Parvularculaceae bacterium]
MRAHRAFALGASLLALTLSSAGAQVAPPAPVEQSALVKDAFATGTLTRGEGALAPNLWRGANVGRLNALLALTPGRLAGPALGEALRRVLLSPGESPEGATPSLGGRRLLALVRAGFSDEARTIASLSSAPKNDLFVAQALASADILQGDLNSACQRNAGLTTGRDADFWVKLRVICYVAAGERDAADLTLNLLREKGSLSDTDDALLGALTVGASPKSLPAPENALHLAAFRQLALPLAPGLLTRANGGVLKAIARDPAADPASRIAAANAAAAMGVVSRGDLAAFYESFSVDPADLGRVSEIEHARPNDPMTDVIVYQAVRQMTAPEFLRDKAARIAEAISAAHSFERIVTLSLLYADEIDAMEGALISPREAGAFAVARMSIGDGDGAARWLFAMLGSGGASSLEESDTMELIDLVNHLAVLDPISAAAVAEAAGVSVSDPRERAAAPVIGAEDESLRMRVIESAFDAAIADIPGQAGLAALAMSAMSGPADPVGDVVIDQSLRAAGLNDLRRRIEFESVWRARFASTGTDVAAPEAAPVPAAPAEDESGLTPRIKPRSEG